MYYVVILHMFIILIEYCKVLYYYLIFLAISHNIVLTIKYIDCTVNFYVLFYFYRP